MRLGDAGVKKDSVGLHTAGEFRFVENVIHICHVTVCSSDEFIPPDGIGMQALVSFS